MVKSIRRRTSSRYARYRRSNWNIGKSYYKQFNQGRNRVIRYQSGVRNRLRRQPVQSHRDPLWAITGKKIGKNTTQSFFSDPKVNKYLWWNPVYQSGRAGWGAYKGMWDDADTAYQYGRSKYNQGRRLYNRMQQGSRRLKRVRFRK